MKGDIYKLARKATYSFKDKDLPFPVRFLFTAIHGLSCSVPSRGAHNKSGNNQRHLPRSAGFLPLVSLCHKSHAAKATFRLSESDFFSNSVVNCHYISVLLTKENEVVAPLPSGLILSCDWWKVNPQQKGMFGAVITHRVPSLGTNFYSHATAGLALDKLTTTNRSLSTAPRQPGWEQREKTPLLLGSTKEMQHRVSQYMEPIYNIWKRGKNTPWK